MNTDYFGVCVSTAQLVEISWARCGTGPSGKVCRKTILTGLPAQLCIRGPGDSAFLLAYLHAPLQCCFNLQACL
jgi:hypothetical protein